MKIAIIDYGAGNIKSVQFALERLGYEGVCTSNPNEIRSADKVIFPGVGAANSAMNELQKSGLNELIPSLKQPVMGICLGMQLMCTSSEENDTACLGIFPMKVQKFNHDLKIPHIGWNQIDDFGSSLFNQILPSGYVYFVHSYYVPLSQFTTSTATYSFKFSATIQKNNFFGCQFHPEKSSDVGMQILNNFLKL